MPFDHMVTVVVAPAAADTDVVDVVVADGALCCRCMGCQWPLCHPSCPGLGDAVVGHSQAECAALSAAGPSGRRVTDLHSMTPLYNVIVPLRILLLQQLDPARWKAVRR